jgi:hypothetical protein
VECRTTERRTESGTVVVPSVADHGIVLGPSGGCVPCSDKAHYQLRDLRGEMAGQMTDGRIAELRGALDRTADPAADGVGSPRAVPLVELARLLLERFHRHGTGPRGTGTADLDEAYNRLCEAYSHLGAGTVGRAQVAGQLGNICAFRSAFTGLSAADTDVAIGYHDEAIEHPGLPAASRELLLVLSALPRALRALPSADQMVQLGRTDMRSLLQNMSWLANGLTPQRRHDLDLASGRLQQVLDGPAVDPRVQHLAGQLLRLTAVIRGVFGVDGPMGMANALGGLQHLWGTGGSALAGPLLTAPLGVASDGEPGYG